MGDGRSCVPNRQLLQPRCRCGLRPGVSDVLKFVIRSGHWDHRDRRHPGSPRWSSVTTRPCLPFQHPESLGTACGCVFRLANLTAQRVQRVRENAGHVHL